MNSAGKGQGQATLSVILLLTSLMQNNLEKESWDMAVFTTY